ncbi:hypothetical protein ENT52713_47290 [Enterobacter sp. 200527-13]|jgi:hypothetical protein|uniref:hypothetical protein n=1 Tax=Enterobacter sp. 200527-13 TaxID=2995131 RepID=UPI0022BF420D|nr:hypothetical protein [Enterobacter sp. 200527-13]GLH27333.1 hypothetical protein ENT52713_47290 [Enterobacter sp. 200527-13]
MMTDNAELTLFWCGLVLVLMVLVHELSRLMPCRTTRYLFLPPGPGLRWWQYPLLAGIILGLLLPASELMLQSRDWQTAGGVLQVVALMIAGQLLFGGLRRLPAPLGWLRPVPALLLSLMLARSGWLLAVWYLTE